MGTESLAHSAFGLMGFWLRAHSGSRNNFLNIYLGAPRNLEELEGDKTSP